MWADLAAQVDAALAPVLAVYGDEPPALSLRLARLDGTVLLDREAHRGHASASLLKLPLAIAVLRADDAGRLRLGTPVRLVNDFPSAAGGRFALDPRADSDPQLWARLGHEVPVHELVHRALAWSSDLATNALFDVLGHTGVAGPAGVTQVARSLGATGVRLHRYLWDVAGAASGGAPNELTAADATTLLLSLAGGTAASAPACRLLLDALADQQFGTEIPLGLPPGVRVAHKTGWTDTVLHDAALVTPPGSPPDRPPYALAVLTSGFVDQPTARRLIRDMARACHRAVAVRA